MENIIKLEEEFEVVVSFPWEGNSLILKLGIKDALENFPEGDSEARRLLTYIGENYPNAKLEELRTVKRKKIFATLSFPSKEELDRFCNDDTITVKAIMPKVSVPWDGGNINISMDFEESWNYFTVRGGSSVWRAHTLIKHLAESYDATLKGMENKEGKLLATLSFSSKDRDEFERFCEEHSRSQFPTK